MDKKYIAKTVHLPHDVLATVLEAQNALTDKLGFTPSISETIAFLANYWHRNRETKS